MIKKHLSNFRASNLDNRTRSFIGWIIFVCTLCCLQTSCTSGPTAPPEGEAHLGKLARAYGMYQAKHRGQTPPSEAKFKEFLKNNKEIRTNFKIDDVNALFISPRDKQPYVVKYGLRSTAIINPKLPPLIAYEKTGVNGKHYVAYGTTEVTEVDEARLKELVGSKK